MTHDAVVLVYDDGVHTRVVSEPVPVEVSDGGDDECWLESARASECGEGGRDPAPVGHALLTQYTP